MVFVDGDVGEILGAGGVGEPGAGEGGSEHRR